jgi:hypothetical protein
MRIERLALSLLCGACAAQQRELDHAADPEFRCDERRAAYEAEGTLVAARHGVLLSCDGHQPVVELWLVSEAGTERRERGTIAVEEWERAWAAFEGAGWRNLGDCDAADGGARASTSFEVADGERRASFSCDRDHLSFPYDTLQRALDLAARELRSEISE